MGKYVISDAPMSEEQWIQGARGGDRRRGDRHTPALDKPKPGNPEDGI